MALSAAPLRGPRLSSASELLRPLEDAVLRKVVLKKDRFYLQAKGEGVLEASLAAEGLRKIGGLMGAYPTSSECETWKPFVRALWRRRQIRILLWLEQDVMPGAAARRPTEAKLVTVLLKKSPRWLTARVFVVSQERICLCGTSLMDKIRLLKLQHPLLARGNRRW